MEKFGLLKKAGIILVVCAAAAIAVSAQTFTMLHMFNGTDGANPFGALIQATDGNFYGTTELGGDNVCQGSGCGTVFRITPDGTLTTLYSFCAQAGCPDGQMPFGGLIQATDGNFYGTTLWGGAYGHGAVFKITPASTLTTLHSFDSTDGANPYAGLIQATDGNFYGTTYAGGPYGHGAVFKITPAGTLTTLYGFCSLTNCTDGDAPTAGLIQATDGNFYGTTHYGGADRWNGTVFKITPAGTLTTLHSFKKSAGCQPNAGLIQATDENFYGTIPFCGAHGYGTVFEITPAGTFASIHSFDLTDGALPYAGLIQAADRSFYGTTTNGGTSCPAYGCGTAFRLAVAPAVTLPSSWRFGNQALNQTSAAWTVTLKNSGTALLIMSGIAIEGSSFTISANTCSGVSLGIGKTCKVSVTFTPTVLGNLTGTLSFTDNASNSPQTVQLPGTGAEPATLMPASINYGWQALGSISTAKTFTLTNNQSVALTSIAITATGDFALSATSCTTSLAAKARCPISVTFTPTSLGQRRGTLSVSDSASNSPQGSALTGMGVLPVTLTPTAVNLGMWAVGTTSLPKTFTLTNNQNVALASIAISTIGDFAVSATSCTTSLAAKSRCTISVTFTPKVVGTRTGTLNVSDSAGNSPQTSSLKGTGT